MTMKTLNLTNQNIYNTADTKNKKMTNIYIEELKEKGLLKGNFGLLAINIYRRTRVNNNEILELFIYGAYIEEQDKLDKQEKQIIYEDVNYYYKQGQEEVIQANKKKKQSSIIPDAIFFALLDMQSANGFNLQQNIQVTIQYNAQQLYKQALINIQQQKELEIENNEFQRIINQQQNSKLYINGDKISGMIDNQLIGLNNMAKVEGIKKQDNNAKVTFLGNIDGKETPMCHSLHRQEFYIDKENIFNRYYGETVKELKIKKIKCFGLILGINLPPISHHFHWCRSMVVYVPPVEKEKKTEYNEVEYVRKNKYTDNRTIDKKIKKVKKKFPKYIQEFINNTPIEIIGKGKNNHYLNGKLYLLNDATEEEIIHEIGHIIEEKLEIANDNKYQSILKNSIGEIDVFNNSIGSIKGYEPDKYEFLLTGKNFISDYQRRVYNIDINKNDRIDYMKGRFNYNVFRDYLPEGLMCYMTDKQLLKMKDIDLYKYIEEVLHERK